MALLQALLTFLFFHTPSNRLRKLNVPISSFIQHDSKLLWPTLTSKPYLPLNTRDKLGHSPSIIVKLYCIKRRKQTISSNPSSLNASHIRKSYPETILKKLFSSVPRRQHAIDDISISIKPKVLAENGNDSEAHYYNGIVLLVGRSSSGKSTLLRLLAKLERCDEHISTIHRKSMVTIEGDSTPIIVDRKPDCLRDKTTSVLEEIFQCGMKKASNSCDITSSEFFDSVRTLAWDFAAALGITEKEMEGPPCDLSPSGQYIFGIACACMMSIGYEKVMIFSRICQPTERSEPTLNQNELKSLAIHYPIIFLDELLDFEHPDIVAKVGIGLKELSRRGAIIVSATHKPQFFESITTRTITLSAGKILTDKYT